MKLCIAIPLCLSLLHICSAQAQVLPNDAVVGGKTIGEWTAECWKWISSISTNENPLLDCDGQGRWANNRQPDPTVFLIAQMNGTTPPPCIRTFTVPENKFILLPVLGVELDNIDIIPPLTIGEMRDFLNAAFEAPEYLQASVDGVPVPNLIAHRATSPAFSIDYTNADNNSTFFYGHPIIGLVDPVITDGYWLMLEPLPPGPHVLHTGGQLRIPFFFPHEIICNITVEATPLSQRVGQLITTVTSSNLPRKHLRPLLATLRAAERLFERGHLRAGVAHLRAFQKKVRHPVSRSDPALAEQLIAVAQQIIDRASLEPPRNHSH